MKAIETYLNIIHFCFYKVHYKLHVTSKKINPFRLLFKIPLIKRKAEKEGINLEASVDRAFGDKEFGLSTMVAGGMLWGFLNIIFFALLLLLNFMVYGTMLHVITVSTLSGVVSYFFVLRNDRYIEYFDKYEKWSKVEKRKYSWFTLGSVVAVFFLFYLGLAT